MPLVTIVSRSEAAGTTTPPGHMQKVYTAFGRYLSPVPRAGIGMSQLGVTCIVPIHICAIYRFLRVLYSGPYGKRFRLYCVLPPILQVKKWSLAALLGAKIKQVAWNLLPCAITPRSYRPYDNILLPRGSGLSLRAQRYISCRIATTTFSAAGPD